MRVDAVAFLEVRDVLADSYDNTHSVRNRNQGLGNHFRIVDAMLDQSHEGSRFPSDHYPVAAVLDWRGD